MARRWREESPELRALRRIWQEWRRKMRARRKRGRGVSEYERTEMLNWLEYGNPAGRCVAVRVPVVTGS